jgi:hypothetical protein
MTQAMLALSIERIARIEASSMGPGKAHLRWKRLRAVRVFHRRFGGAPFLDRHSQWHAPNQRMDKKW